ncbi:MAG: methyltransferase domain-containing protein [Planctomycetes bacterium]|nr:methyltransferase domain-containing protein [Planctomycetota bacterium]
MLGSLDARGDGSARRGVALDLGCGTGEGTSWLAERSGCATTIGLDTSAAMLERAPRDLPGLHFVRGDIAAPPLRGPVDVLFSNAALHWLPDHPALLARLTGLVAPGGRLAVQVPGNHRHPSQRVAVEVAREEPFASLLGGFVRESPVLEPERYVEILHGLGFTDLDVRVVVYPHLLPEPADVVGWVRGTTLTDYERRLPEQAYARFLERYREALLAVLPDERPCLFTFRRVFFAARRPG